MNSSLDNLLYAAYRASSYKQENPASHIKINQQWFEKEFREKFTGYQKASFTFNDSTNLIGIPLIVDNEIETYEIVGGE